ncbi:MAG TPA: hypothetical protein ENK89_00735 [Desulfobulbaceae bacterium]|nr:hypothetical protein [Desulfobulbaceae bacterium]HHD63236.1 hypothetical protein [Desulfobulbaceae bacterium]
MNNTSKILLLRILTVSFLLQCTLATSPAFAIQLHGPPEGLYVHQIGHVLYGLAMLGFAFRIRVSRLAHMTAWKLMTLGAFLLACWNGWAFIAHILDIRVPSIDFLLNEQGIKMGLILRTPVDWLYYLFKMDHLICVPALLCIYLSLRRMNEQPPLPTEMEQE